MIFRKKNKHYKMTTVADLRNLAKERGLKGYSKLRKDELLRLLKGRQTTHYDDIPKCSIREHLRSLGEKVSGTKSEMIERLNVGGGNRQIRQYRIPSIRGARTPRDYQTNLNQLTKCQIREELRSRSLPVSGSKDEIVRRLAYSLAGKKNR